MSALEPDKGGQQHGRGEEVGRHAKKVTPQPKNREELQELDVQGDKKVLAGGKTMGWGGQGSCRKAS